MEATPQAVWLNGGTPAQVRQQVRQTTFEAALQHAVPTFVAYNIPGRDCAEFSAGGAEPARLRGVDQRRGQPARSESRPSSWSSRTPWATCPRTAACRPRYPFTDDERTAEVGYAVTALESDPNASVYLDGTNSDWQSVGTISQRLLAANVQASQGFFLNVSNYQSTRAGRLRHLDLGLHRHGDGPRQTGRTASRATAPASTTRRRRATSAPGT